MRVKGMHKIRQLYHGLSVQMRAAIWFIICNVILKGISFFTTPLFTRILPASEYGLFSVITSYMEILLYFSTWELALGIYQKGLFKYKGDEPLLTYSVLVFDNILTLIVFVLVVIFWEPFHAVTGFTVPVTTVTFLYLLVLPAYSCWMVRKRTLYDYKAFVAATIFFTALNIFIPLGACRFIQGTAEVRYISGYIPLTIAYAYFYARSIQWKKLVGNLHKVKEYFLFFLRNQPPLAVHALSYMILGQIDRVMIGRYVDNASAGIYSIGYSVASIASLVQSAVATVLVPWTFSNLQNKAYESMRGKIMVSLFFQVGIYLLFILVAPEVILLLFTEEYHEAIWCIPPVAVGIFFLFVQSLFVNVETFLEQTVYVAYVSIVCAGINILLNYVGIQLFGYIACAYSTLICYIFFALGHGVITKKLLKKYLGNAPVFHERGICAVCIMMLVLMGGVSALYPYPGVRYGMVVAVLLSMVLCRKKLFLWLESMLSGVQWGKQEKIQKK